jgi:hypothetical protein
LNLAQFRSRVQNVVGLNSSTEVSLIDGWVNDAVVDFLTKTKAHKRLMEVACTADEMEYLLDTDMLAIEKLYFVPADSSRQTRLLEPADSADLLMASFQNASTEDNGTRFYALEGAHLLLLYPAPSSSADKLRGIYVPRPGTMSATGASPSSSAYGGIPAEFHPTLEAYAKWKAAEYDDDSSSGEGRAFKEEYDQGVALAKLTMNKKAGMRLAGATWGKRSKRVGWPHDPSVDWGN